MRLDGKDEYHKVQNHLLRNQYENREVEELLTTEEKKGTKEPEKEFGKEERS